MRVPAFLLALVVFVMASYLLTADYPYHPHPGGPASWTRACSASSSQLRATALAAFGGYLRAELLLSVCVFFILLVGFSCWCRQPYALLLALGLAVLDFIPIIGSGTVMVPWAVVALFTRDYSTAIEHDGDLGHYRPVPPGGASPSSWATRPACPPSSPSSASMWA